MQVLGHNSSGWKFQWDDFTGEGLTLWSLVHVVNDDWLASVCHITLKIILWIPFIFYRLAVRHDGQLWHSIPNKWSNTSHRRNIFSVGCINFSIETNERCHWHTLIRIWYIINQYNVHFGSFSMCYHRAGGTIPAKLRHWPTIYDVGPTVNQRWANVWWLLWGVRCDDVCIDM